MLLLICVACSKSGNRSDQQIADKREAYYDRIPDAPLDLYCYVNTRINPRDRLQLCSIISDKCFDNLTLNVGLTINGGQLKRTDLHAIYFDLAGNAHDESISAASLDVIFDSLIVSDIPTLSAIKTEEFVLRMQLERLCPGYVHSNRPAIDQRLKTD